MALIKSRGVDRRNSRPQEENKDEYYNEIKQIDDFDLIENCRIQRKNLAIPKQTKLRLLNSLIEPVSKHPRERENAINGSNSAMVNRSNNSNANQLRDQLESMLQEQINRQAFLSSFGTLAAILFRNFNVTIG
ncbi:unnamed protein product [Brachionus calyciflorus]|uniref:Uncharacterized protein n=1 Tax=Brachionus calyciflorus TaxID=104777 RepID=A0A814D9E0_9BILA|nr:unnamed protein product [Brachionus calyciflorus]